MDTEQPQRGGTATNDTNEHEFHPGTNGYEPQRPERGSVTRSRSPRIDAFNHRAVSLLAKLLRLPESRSLAPGRDGPSLAQQRTRVSSFVVIREIRVVPFSASL
jgi:hypothetical protein